MSQHFLDQMGRPVIIPAVPQRIISLVPSQTELLFDLGLAEQVVGVTKFCVHPAGAQKKPSVGGTKQFRFEQIEQLRPDLILGNKEENYEEGINQLAEKYPVWMSDIKTLAHALEMINQVGQLTGRTAAAQALAQEIEQQFKALPVGRPWRVAYFIWQKPYMVAGQDTFIQAILEKCGWVNVLAHLPGRYPEVTAEQIAQAEPDFLLLSSEPFPFAAKHQQQFAEMFQRPAVLVNGEFFSWYGSRLRLAPSYFHQLQTTLASYVF
jgi:ABC-type Fe3+-hydroxamate transport system substrate-binding protein